MIYKYCLIHHEDIDPHPPNYNAPLIKAQDKHTWALIKGFKRRLNERIGFSKEWPSVSLLGVNKAIRHEAATILFGKNVWWISDVDVHGMNIWETYRHYFRHIATSFDMRDVTGNQLLAVSNKVLERGIVGDEEASVSCESPITRKHTHDLRIATMRSIWLFKVKLLQNMQLHSLVLDVDNLLCPSACCRVSMISSLCINMGSNGPWYQKLPFSWIDDSLAESDTLGPTATKRYTDVKVIGLRNLDEARMVQRHWGLDIDDKGELPVYRKNNPWQKRGVKAMYRAKSVRGREPIYEDMWW